MPERANGLTYAKAGVDIDAGAALVEAIKPLARATRRPGADAALGGFGALFDLKAAGYADPLLVSTTDGVGTKLKIAIETGLADDVGSTWSPCASTTCWPRAPSRCFSSTTSPPASWTWTRRRRVVAGIAEGCRQAGARWSAARRRRCRASTRGGDYDLAGFCVGAVERGRLLPRWTPAPRRPADRPRPPPARTPTAIR